jgi:hypothetical protein
MNTQLRSLEEIRRIAGAELSFKARLGYVALLLVAAAMSAVVGSLWLTEPALPVRTRFAFGTLCIIGVSWMSLATWALASRRPLFARDRLIAGRLAVAFTAVFVTGAVAAVIIARNAAALAVLGTGVVMLVLAVRVLADAHRRFAALAARRRELEQVLAG